MINTFFDKIFVINLDRRKDRWNSMLKQFKKLGITNYERFSAICPKKDELDKSHYKNFNKQNIKLNSDYIAGAMGCRISHIEIIKLAKSRNYNNILILEDDAIFIDNFQQIFNNTIDTLSREGVGYDMFYLGGNHKTTPEQILDNIGITKHTLTTHAYAMHARIFDYVLENIQNYDGEIDKFYVKLQKKNYCLATIKSIILQSDGFSDIRNKETNYSHLIN